MVVANSCNYFFAAGTTVVVFHFDKTKKYKISMSIPVYWKSSSVFNHVNHSILVFIGESEGDIYFVK